MKEAKWNQDYDVGVAGIDKAHRALLATVKDIFALLEEEDEQKNHTLLREKMDRLWADIHHHLAEEEVYMQYVDYEGFARHRQQHDRARLFFKELGDEVVRTNYAPEAILQVLGRAIGWMTGHVPEDMAITGKGYRRNIPVMSDYVTKLSLAIEDVVRGIFHMNAELVDEHFKGEDMGEATYHELHYLSSDGKRLTRYMVIMEKQLIRASAGSVISKTFRGLNQVAFYAMKEITHMIFQEVGTYFRDEISHFTLVHESILTPEEGQSRFHSDSPFYSLLFRTEAGRFAICFNIDDN